MITVKKKNDWKCAESNKEKDLNYRVCLLLLKDQSSCKSKKKKNILEKHSRERFFFILIHIYKV